LLFTADFKYSEPFRTFSLTFPLVKDWEQRHAEHELKKDTHAAGETRQLRGYLSFEHHIS
jgi:hypothetical protein